MSKVRSGWVLLSLLAMVACGKKEEEKKAATTTPVSVVQVVQRTVVLTEESVGTLDSPADTVLAAEVAGKLLGLRVRDGETVQAGQLVAEIDAQDANLSLQAAQADVRRLESLSSNDARRLQRMQQLREQNFISSSGLDDTAAQAATSQSQLAVARAQLVQAERNVAKTRIVSPFEGRAERQMAAPGQYLKVGDPVYQVVYLKKLRARLPYPEDMAGRIKPGMEVQVSSPGVDKVVIGRVDEVRPTMGANNRSFDVFAVFDNPGWRPGATLSGAVVLGRHPNAWIVPEASVVLRPAGKVVYLAQGGKAVQRVVQTGARQPDGWVEVTSGLQGGETVVTDGAGFLTDGAALAVGKAGAAN
ncbi:MAG: efflux RND transporter periplasmic adaptor subunit [Nitrosomonadales bacterium]|nr:efflux RND transporter periplasmic adaptor subunit [Nitrosomonadales bacterium]